MYQPGYTDRWYHRYTYDADNRLILAETSYDSAVWETEARYEYYKHGPLARVVIGHQQVQGVDYAYTLQGWLKGINSTGATLVHDMGGDGTDGGANQYTARDALGLTLNYFAGEYTPVNSGVNPFPAYSAYLNNEYRPLYNGNISSMSVYNRQLTTLAGGALTFSNYHYDQLNRYTGVDVYRGLDTLNNTWSGIQIATTDSIMKERVSYDANGNILTYLRNAAQAWPKRMDELTYSYYPGTNRLRRIRDVVDSNHIGSNSWEVILDIDDQLEEDNYVYDEIGNLVQDKAEQITGINWNVYGKITEINRIAEPAVDVSAATYTYDALGNRIGKVYDFKGTKNYVWYVRDAQGNVLSTYTVQGNGELDSLNLSQSEVFLYGSSRIGVYNEGRPVDFNNSGPGTTEFYSGNTLRRDYRQYELTNHLGNVLATISDRKYGVSSGGSLIDFYVPDIVSANDYYPFGMPSRLALSSTGVHYRHGFNGQEHDSEIKGWQNMTHAKNWEYDVRIGRRWNLDPRPNVSISPYAAFNNNPVFYSDPLGDTVVVGAGGTHSIDIDETVHSLEFYPSSDYTIKRTSTPVPAQKGQLRSFTNALGRFTAKWTTDESGNAVFAGYLNDKNQTFDKVLQDGIDLMNSWVGKLYQLGDYIERQYAKDPVGWNLKVTMTMLTMSATAAVEPVPYVRGFNPSVTTQEALSGLGTLSIASRTTGLAKYWPANGGALGQWSKTMAVEGQVLDRYGSIFGAYASPVGTPFEMRALSSTTADYFKFQILKPFPMEKSIIAPAFGRPGLGIQYRTPIGLNYLEQLGYIKILK